MGWVEDNSKRYNQNLGYEGYTQSKRDLEIFGYNSENGKPAKDLTTVESPSGKKISLRDANNLELSSAELMRRVKRLQELQIQFMKEINRTDSNIVRLENGKKYQHLTPKATILMLQIVGIPLQISPYQMAKYSYPLDKEAAIRNKGSVLEEVGRVIQQGTYDTVLWMPGAWQDAISSGEKYDGRVLGPEMYPSRPTFWWHAIPLRFSEYPVGMGGTDDAQSTLWWTDQWEMLGFYIFPSSRTRALEISSRMGLDGRSGRNVSDPALGVIIFWRNTQSEEIQSTASEDIFYENDETHESASDHIMMDLGKRFTEKSEGLYALIASAYAYLKSPFQRNGTNVGEGLNDEAVDVGNKMTIDEVKDFKKRGIVIPEIRTVLARRVEAVVASDFSGNDESGESGESGKSGKSGKSSDSGKISVWYQVEPFMRLGKRIRGTDGKWLLNDNGEYVRRNPEKVTAHTRGDLNKPQSTTKNVKKASR